MPSIISTLSLTAILLSTSRAELDWTNSTAIVESAKVYADTLVNGYYGASPPGHPLGLFLADEINGRFDEYIIWSQSAVIWETLTTYANLTGDMQYNDRVVEALYAQAGENEDYMPKNRTSLKPADLFGNQNQSQWALAALSAAELESQKPIDGKPTFLKLAQNVFDSQVARWDNDTCGGGLREAIVKSKDKNATDNFNWKTAASNSNFFLLAARLHRITGNETYADWAESSFTWAQKVGMIAGNWSMKEWFQIVDDKCEGFNDEEDTGLSSSFGNFLEGATTMANITYNIFTGEHETWKDRANSLSDTIETFRTGQKRNQTINNPCPGFSLDEPECGAIRTTQYAHSLGRATYFGQGSLGGAMITYIPNYLQWSADAAASLCTSAKSSLHYSDGSEKNVDFQTYCDGAWGTNQMLFQVGDVRNAAAALEVLQGSLWTMKRQSAATPTSGAPAPTATDKKGGAETLKGRSSVVAAIAAVVVAVVAL
ncbi:glycoside hydrolase [Lophiotrema nucula]|uniref:Mannan endo-1,6-alpha-mannosidase n=1 Tax=Lophiotrema nucula TaxID=690887 RepID=A0A6A5ZDC5_9PLEO|nr:glycoside hydrolase [Lophiotrema nucula]